MKPLLTGSKFLNGKLLHLYISEVMVPVEHFCFLVQRSELGTNTVVVPSTSMTQLAEFQSVVRICGDLGQLIAISAQLLHFTLLLCVYSWHALCEE